MIEVYITDIQNEKQAERILNKINDETNVLKINFDFNETERN
ncbi:hypothetical protein ACYE2N_01690 [Flavobacterium sp. MAHUQ-51]